MHCGYCGELYDLGQKISRPSGFHHFPDGEYAYWRHAGSSHKHQLTLDIMSLALGDLLAHLPDVMNAAKVHQKLMRDPALAPLRRLFR